MTTKDFASYLKQYKNPHGTGTVPFFAHRGLSSLAPDNSMMALERAFESEDVDGVEFDLQRTADGKIVARHHRSVRTSTDQVWLEDMSLSEYRKYADEEHSPGLGAVLEIASSSQKVLDVELKSSGITKQVLQACKEKKLLDRVILTTIYDDIYKEVREQYPEIALMYGYPKDRGKDLAQQKWTQPFVKVVVASMRFRIDSTVQQLMQEVETPFLSFYHKVMTPSMVKLLHEHQKYCIGCTINLQNDTGAGESVKTMQTMLDQGVDLIKTDYPQLRSTLRQ
jgi:glycerophosphoryl diester phosphodiesterase